MKACGVEADMQVIVPPILGNPVAQKVREFSPDAVTVIQWKTLTTSTRYGVQAVNYDLEMTDMQSKMVIWKAQMAVGGVGTDVPQNFTVQLIDQFKKDGILQANCPTPKEAHHA
jgi:hypothetical protein